MLRCVRLSVGRSPFWGQFEARNEANSDRRGRFLPSFLSFVRFVIPLALSCFDSRIEFGRISTQKKITKVAMVVVVVGEAGEQLKAKSWVGRQVVYRWTQVDWLEISIKTRFAARKQKRTKKLNTSRSTGKKDSKELIVRTLDSLQSILTSTHAVVCFNQIHADRPPFFSCKYGQAKLDLTRIDL